MPWVQALYQDLCEEFEHHWAGGAHFIAVLLQELAVDLNNNTNDTLSFYRLRPINDVPIFPKVSTLREEYFIAYNRIVLTAHS